MEEDEEEVETDEEEEVKEDVEWEDEVNDGDIKIDLTKLPISNGYFSK